MYQVKLHQNVLTKLGSIESANEQPEKRSDGIEFSNDTNRRLTGRSTEKQHVHVGELAMPPNAFIKYKNQGITGVSPLHNQHGKTQTDDEEIAKILNNQFASVFSQDDGLSPPIGGPVGADIADLKWSFKASTRN